MLKLLAFVLPLGPDSFAVAAAIGAAGVVTPPGTIVAIALQAFAAAQIGLAIGAGSGNAGASGPGRSPPSP